MRYRDAAYKRGAPVLGHSSADSSAILTGIKGAMHRDWEPSEAAATTWNREI